MINGLSENKFTRKTYNREVRRNQDEIVDSVADELLKKWAY